jgi:hypothetical protein
MLHASFSNFHRENQLIRYGIDICARRLPQYAGKYLVTFIFEAFSLNVHHNAVFN